MTYTIISAAYANAEHTAAILMTEEAARVLISENDTKAEWAAMLAWGKPAAYAAPPAPAPAEISDRQFAQGLATQGMITEQEAEDWVGPGVVPAAMLALVNKLPEGQRFSARMLLRGATKFQRAHPLVEVIATLHNPPISSAQLDDYWRAWSAL